MTSSSTRRIVGFAAVALVVPLMAACTESLGASGNGTQFIEADVRIENATIVAGDPKSGKAAFLGTVFNTSTADDQVLSIVADGVPAAMKPTPVPIATQSSVAIQTGREVTADFSDFTANEGTYVAVSVTFEKAGEAKFQALVVPPAGFYAKAAPPGTQPESVIPTEETDATVLEEHNAAG